MTRREVLEAFKEGRLTLAETRERLLDLQSKIGFPLSEGQKGLWVLQQISSGRSDYNIPLCFRVSQRLDVELLQRACELLQEQYPILKSVVEEKDGVPQQRICDSAPIWFCQEDISDHQQDGILILLRERAKRPFSLHRGPMWRVHVLSRSVNEHVVLIVVHHIVFDGSSVPLLVKKLLEGYEELRRGIQVPPRLLRSSYRDFVEWEQAMLMSTEGQAHRTYWKEQLSGVLPVLSLPSDRPRLLGAIVKGRTYARGLSSDVGKRVQESSSALGVTRAVLFLGTFYMLLHRYAGETDIIVGMPTVGRPQLRFDELIGYFVNMIALRSRIENSQQFAEWIQALQKTLVDGLDHAAYPFPRVVRDLNVPRELGRSPVFQVAYEYQSATMLTPSGLGKQKQGGLQIEFVEGLYQEGEYELVLEVVENDADLELHFKYDASLFEESTIARMAGHYVNLLSQVIERPNRTLSSYQLLTAEELQQQCVEWNATQVERPSNCSIHSLFKEQVRRTPQATAVVFEDLILTYRELDERSDQLAACLKQRGVRSGDRIGLCVERSLDLPIGLLGILKVGAAYVPLDPTYPYERLRYMLQDSGACCLVTQSVLLSSMSDLIDGSMDAVCMDQVIVARPSAQSSDAVGEQGSVLAPDVTTGANELAYVMYTSGSTGQPKGVMITHRSLANFLRSMSHAPGLASHDRLLAVTTYSFDIAGLELYLPLLVGAECHICSTAKAKDAELLKQEIARVQPTVMQATPTTWSMLLQIGWRNEERVRVLCGGEALPSTLRKRFVAHGWDAWNLYGPTETTVWSTVEKVVDPEGHSIGKPIENTQLYILDQYKQPTPILVPGELCIAGDGLALGYFNQPSLTTEKFIDHPFEPGSKLYRTGDLAYWRADGSVEYVGRLDAQVKLRGYRLELEEIEVRLAILPQIQSCAVVVSEHEGHKQLVAYYVMNANSMPHALDRTSSSIVHGLRGHLKTVLPEYMVPARFVALDALPLTPNGKVDRKQLAQRAVTLETLETMEASARTPAQTTDATPAERNTIQRIGIEQRLASIWQRALAVEGIGVDQGFFDVGGDSVLAVTVAARIGKEFECDFSVTEIFRFGTIRQIANHLLVRQRESVLASAPTTAKNSSALLNQEAQSEQSSHHTDLPAYYEDGVAIVGISCQFPGAEDHRQFWNNLINGAESIHILTPEVLRRKGVPESLLAQPNYVPAQATITGKEFFDAEFFKVSPRDAELMDPQLRLLLQHAWNAVEDAGYIAKEIPNTSVVIASSYSDYAVRAMAARHTGSAVLGSSEQYVSWLLAQSGTIPTMISHRLGFKGSSVAVHSNCSSSLVAIDAAYRNLITGQSKQALIGAATVWSADNLGYVHQKGLNFSSDGRVRTFDAAADGMIGGEGVAVVVLKRVLDAIADDDHIYAVIRGIAVNNDGAEKVGFYAPSAEGQTEVIDKVLRETSIDPRSITYVEAHGTGTELGDPIELAAISAAYRRYTNDIQFCGIGSVKTNVGHLDTAAGLAGLIKVALSLEHCELPPTLHYHTPNPKFALDASPFYVVDRRTRWNRGSGPRRAALSSFGIGGTNTHAILEEAPMRRVSAMRAARSMPLTTYIVLLSAKTEERLKEKLKQLSAHVSAHPFGDADLADLAYTLQVGREAMEHRLAFTVTTVSELQEKLAGCLEGNEAQSEDEACYRGEVKKNKEALSIFNTDAALQAAIGTWVEHGEYAKLLALWVKGLAFDWTKLYGERSAYGAIQPKRISLPTYPFAKERHWMEPSVVRRIGLEVSESVEKEETIDEEGAWGEIEATSIEENEWNVEQALAEPLEPWLFTEEWQDAEVVRPIVPARIRTVVVLLSDAERQREVEASIRQNDSHARVAFVAQAGSVEAEVAQGYGVERDVPASYTQVFSRIAEAHGPIDAVWVLWGLEDASCLADQSPILYLLQGLASAGIKQTKVWLCGEYQGAVERSLVESWIGYERSVSRVLPGVQVAVIQSALAAAGEVRVAGDGMAQWAQRLWAATCAEKIESALYIGEQRQVLRIQPQALSNDAQAVGLRQSRLRMRGTYLITGGMGGLGSVFAAHLAKVYSANLILTGRSPLGAAQQAKLEALEALGGQALYVQADVSDAKQMGAALEQGFGRFGELHGVLHAAGVASSVTLLEQDRSRIEAVLAPKIGGTQVLADLLKNTALDFLCYFSSTSAVLGDFGSCDYAVGNRFELAYAKYVEPRGIALCWPLWAEGEMGLPDAAATQLYLQSSGQRALSTAEGMELFERLLAQHCNTGLRHGVVMVGEKSRVHRLLQLPAPSGAAQGSGAVRPAPRRPELQGLSLAQAVVWELKELASELLKIPREQLQVEENLAEFGFDSIGLASFAKRLSGHYGIEVLPSVFFSYATLNRLAEYLLAEHAQGLQQYYGEPPRGRSVARRAGVSRAGVSRAARASAKRIQSPSSHDLAEPIAIIGMSGRFPGARNVEELWQILVTGKEAVEEIPLSRFDWRGVYQAPSEASGSSVPTGKTHSKWLGMLPGVDEFDALFFEISPREAQGMDPRQRLLLQESFNALEDAGYGNTQLRTHKIGMFVGVEQGEYQFLVGDNAAEGSVTANHDAILAARLSYCLNLQGPAMAINTACSSGLVAAHQACQSLRAGDCDTAIAAGVNLALTPHGYILMSQAGMLSPDGRCYAFDRRANGMVPGEAVVAIVLKRLSHAQADGDVIYATVRGSGINYDGKTNGLTAPNGAAQTALINEVYARAQVAPRDIEYIVTHGTGTRLGDPVEINALRAAFKDAEHPEPFCALTSTKTNFGHTFAASGLVSLVSLVQALRHELIPASLHCEQLSDYIDWQRSPFYVNTQNKAWPKQPDQRRLGAVSAFGMSGTNVHLVVESVDSEAHALAPSVTAPYYLLVLSAKTEAALQQRALDLIDLLNDERRGTPSLAALSHTLLNHRQHFNYRCAVLIADREQALHLLEKVRGTEKLPTLLRGKVARDFAEQPLLVEYAEGLLGTLCTLHDDPERYQQTLAALAELYCQGYSLNWHTLYGDHPPQRISLPTYPFAKERHWISEVRRPPHDKVSAPRNSTLKPLALAAGGKAAIVDTIDAKPRGILLQGLSNESVLSGSTTEQQRVPLPLQSLAVMAAEMNPAQFQSIASVQHIVAVDTLEAELTSSLAEALFMERADIDSERPFVELGLDSIVGVEWIRTINNSYGLSVPTTKLYDYPSIRQLAAYLATLLDAGRLTACPPPPMAMEPSKEPDGAPSSAATMSLESLEAELTASLAEALYLECAAIQSEQPFVELGLDSIVGVEWIRTLNKTYALSIPTTKLYDYPTIHQLARFLHPLLKPTNVAPERAELGNAPPASVTDVFQGIWQGTVTAQDAEAMLRQFGVYELELDLLDTTQLLESDCASNVLTDRIDEALLQHIGSEGVVYDDTSRRIDYVP